MTAMILRKGFLKTKSIMKIRSKRNNSKSRLPIGELVSQGEVIVMYGDRRMTVQGCRKILAYSPTEIRLQLKYRRLCVRGEALGCSAFSGGCTTLQGRIASVFFEETERRGGA